MAAYVANNPILYNACLAGFAAGAGAGSNPSGTGAAVTAANASIVAQAEQVAQAVDTAILADATITTAGATTPPTTSAIQNAQLSKSGAMRVIAYAAGEGQASGNGTTVPAGPLAAIATGIAAKYAAVIAAPFSLL